MFPSFSFSAAAITSNKGRIVFSVGIAAAVISAAPFAATLAGGVASSSAMLNVGLSSILGVSLAAAGMALRGSSSVWRLALYLVAVTISLGGTYWVAAKIKKDEMLVERLASDALIASCAAEISAETGGASMGDPSKIRACMLVDGRVEQHVAEVRRANAASFASATVVVRGLRRKISG